MSPATSVLEPSMICAVVVTYEPDDSSLECVRSVIARCTHTVIVDNCSKEPRRVALRQLQSAIGFESLLYDDRIGKVSLIGAGMRSHPGVTATFFGALAEAGVNIEMISTSEIRISVVVDQKDVNEAVNAAHKAFELDADEVEAVVYGGTGR